MRCYLSIQDHPVVYPSLQEEFAEIASALGSPGTGLDRQLTSELRAVPLKATGLALGWRTAALAVDDSGKAGWKVGRPSVLLSAGLEAGQVSLLDAQTNTPISQE